MTENERSRGGCATCKQKHIKCDQTRPQCNKCTSKRRTCPGYTPRLVWKPTIVKGAKNRAAKKRKTNAADASSFTASSTRSISPSGSRDQVSSDAQDLTQGDCFSEKICARVYEAPDVNQQQIPQEQLLEWDCEVPSFDDQAAWMFGSFLLRPPGSVGTHSKAAIDDLPATFVPRPLAEGVGYQDLDLDPLTCIEREQALDINTASEMTCEALLGPSYTQSAPSPGFTMTATDECFRPSVATAASSREEIDDLITRDKDRFKDSDFYEYNVNADSATSPLADHHHLPAEQSDRLAAGWGLSTGMRDPGYLDSNTKQDLTSHYFNTICPILSCFDSHENPFRSDIPIVMLTRDYVHDCVIGMSAAHLANKNARMEGIALSHQSRAMAGLSMVLKTIQNPVSVGNGQIVLRDPHSRLARYQALLAAMLLGISSAWYDASAANLPHLIGARSLFQAWLVDEGFTACSNEPVLLSRQQSFLVGAMVYLECLAAFIFDQPPDSLEYLRRFRTLAKGQRVYPNPWTGVSTPIFLHLAETAILMRCKRTSIHHHSSMPQPRPSVDFCNTITRMAKNLYETVLRHRPPPIRLIDDTKDSVTPIGHLVDIDIIFRFVILMELVQAFPRLSVGSDCETNDIAEITVQTKEMSFDCAIAILSSVSQIPEGSGVNIMLSIPLIAAGSALQIRQRPGIPESTATPRGIRDSISAFMHGKNMLKNWREQTQYRLERTHRRVGVAPLRWASRLIKEVWRCADAAPPVGGDCIEGQPLVHWMDIMIDEKLGTFFG